jgi:rod shape-determining protein MreC
MAIVFVGKTDSTFFDRTRAKLSDLISPMLSQVRDPMVTFQLWAGNLTSLFSTYGDNLELRRENAELRKWQHVALSLEQRLRRYETLLNAVPDAQLPAVTARVIGESSRPFIKTMILDAGSAQSVKKGQAVVDERGLIGRTFVVGERTSWVILLTDLNSHVPVFIESSRRRAILTGDNTPTPHLELDIGTNRVKAGDRVLSSGDGGLLPPDLPIGTIVADGDDYRVALFATPEASDYVRILDYALPPEPSTNPLESEAPPAVADTQPVSPQTPAQPVTPQAQAKPPVPAVPAATVQPVRPPTRVPPQVKPIRTSTTPAAALEDFEPVAEDR